MVLQLASAKQAPEWKWSALSVISRFERRSGGSASGSNTCTSRAPKNI
jgi:hypothetical protein